MLNNQSIENTVDDFNSGGSGSEDEGNIISQSIDININIYNPAVYNFEYTYNFLKTHEILYTNYRCPICNNIMSLVTEKNLF